MWLIRLTLSDQLLYEWNDTHEMRSTDVFYWNYAAITKRQMFAVWPAWALTRTQTPSVSRFYEKAPCLIKARTTRTTLRFQSNRNTRRVNFTSFTETCVALVLDWFRSYSCFCTCKASFFLSEWMLMLNLTAFGQNLFGPYGDRTRDLGVISTTL